MNLWKNEHKGRLLFFSFGFEKVRKMFFLGVGTLTLATLHNGVGLSKESINKILIVNRFHVKLRILNP